MPAQVEPQADEGDRPPARAIVDAHHHLWDPGRNYHPWLCDQPPIAFRYGDYAAIRRPYLVADYRADAAPWRIEASVYVETEWDPRDPVGEMDYVAGLRAASGLPSVAVAQAWLDRADSAAILDSHAARGFVRSVRHKPRANATPREAAPGGMTDPAWRAGFARLAPLGLAFDLQTPWWHLGEAARLAADFPDTRIFLNHAGLPADRSPEGLAAWKAAMARLAEAPNVACKISGLGQPGAAWTIEANRFVVLTAIDLFGVGRCMFASNFPVDSLCASFAQIYRGFGTIVADFAEPERDALFRANARRLYAIVNDDV
ncbi:MAG: amidohydrolase family protein [Methylobacteriaceae bacterium]|nr:amidohydrolase family protein [Methylobacteriaceae bacterium]